ncbi:hypothetical protein [Helicobacter sp. MIT 05-5294]|uniref:hypothetical protein n=1 Tax=Helicobacter sp. MIT 05-5294 TaxID=1548150 RepID=UPI00051F87CA|nr:hypothetical protein [Helicobacter sp. MIT 05-5294]TLD88653.1 hypothetical protein LS69_001850 [Helicobacter sp. MIT 05-5294]
MVINQNLNSLSGIYNNEANRILNENVQSTNKTQSKESHQQNQESFETERITYGMISLELMNDEQYQAFERVTAGMSPNEKISVAQMLTRAGNLSASVERVEQKEKESQDSNSNDKDENELGFLGITKEGWREVAKEFQNSLNHLEGLYTKNYNKNPTSNYNDILRKNTEAKTQRILREFSHAIYSGNVQIDTMS